MHRLTAVPIAAACCALVASPASAEIVKAPTGEKSAFTVNAATAKALKRAHVTLAAISPGTRSGTHFALPYSLARWDFASRDGDVAHFTKQTGFRFRAGKRSIAMTHPRLVMDSARAGYVSALVSNVRVKTFTVSGTAARVTDSASAQQVSGLKLKLTKAGADYVNAKLHRKALRRYGQFGTLDLHLLKPAGTTAPGGATTGTGDNPGGSVTFSPGLLGSFPGGTQIAPLLPGTALDTDGDGRPDAGAAALPLEDVSFDADTKTGTIKLGGGLSILVPGASAPLTIQNPEIVLGATPDASGLYGQVNGVRIKVGDLDSDALDLDVANGTVTIKQLKATVSGALAPLLNGVLGTGLIQSGTPLLSLDLSFPQL